MSDTEDQLVLVDRRDAVAVLTLNRPERLNAWTRAMMRQLMAAVRAANADDSIGAIVLTGAGRGFCAGADIGAQFASALDGQGPVIGDRSVPSDGDWVALCRSSKPMVAALNGPPSGSA